MNKIVHKYIGLAVVALFLFIPITASAQVDMDKQLSERQQKKDEYDDSDKDRHGGNLVTFYLTKRIGDKRTAPLDTIRLNYFHRAFIEGLSIAEAYGGTYASPYQSKVYFDRPLNRWDEFFFTNPYHHLIHRGERQQWYNTKVPYSLLKYTSSGSDRNKEQNLGFKFSSNLGPKWSLGGDFDLDYANGFYGSSMSNNITYRIFGSYEGDRYKAYASVGNTNTINQENGGVTDPKFITNPNDFIDGKRKLLPKDIPTKFKSTWNRVVYGEGRFNHRFSLGFYREVDEKGNFIETKEAEKKQEEETPTPPTPTLPTPPEQSALPANDSIPSPLTPLNTNDSTAIAISEAPIVAENELDNTPEEGKANPPVRKRAGKSSGLQDDSKEDEKASEKETKKKFIPVTSFFHDFSYQKGRRSWVSQDPIFEELYPEPIIPKPSGAKYFPNDRFSALKISNSIGIELMEGFHKWAKMGIAAFVAHDYEHYIQPLLNQEDAERLELPIEKLERKENTTYVGGRLSSNSFKHFGYYVWGQFGIAGTQIGEIELNGEITTNFKILKKDVHAKATIDFLNSYPSYFLRQYKASLQEWNQELSMIQLMRVGGELVVPFTKTRVHANFETLQNPIMVNKLAQPEQVKTNTRVLAVGLDQKLSWRFLNLENSVVWQKSSNPEITPLPEWALYSNFYFRLLIAKVMTMQLGVDAKWHTAYHAPFYESSTQLFRPQNEVTIGGKAPLLSVYANVHLKRSRFFLMYYNIGALFLKPSHFTMPNYPLYPPTLRLGVIVDLRN